jgi:nitrite reductase (cytochrome c-552)
MNVSHKWPENELMGRVEAIQHRTFELRNRARDAVVALIADLKNARETGHGGASR